MWQTGSATDYFDLLNELKLIATARHVATAAINAAGTGYTVGDVLTIAGGTSTHVATLEVLTITGGGGTGPIGSVRITNAGAYSVDPTTTANAVTGGTGASATIDLTMAGTGWTVLRESERALSATVSAAGNGYNIGDELEVQGGLGIGSSNLVSAAVFVVATLTGGAGSGVATVTVKSGSEGNYEETPANAAATVALTGTGDDACTLTVTYESRVPDDHSILVLEGAAAGSPDPVQVAIKTFDDTDGIFNSRNWALFGFANDFSTLAMMHQQSGISPGWTAVDDGVAQTYGACVPLKDNDGGGSYPLDYYFSITDRRILMAVQIDSATIDAWMTMYLGFTNQYGTTDELPYPVVIAGCASTMAASALNVSISPVKSSIVHVLCDSYDETDDGPAFMLTPAGMWRQLANGTLNSGNAFSRRSQWVTTPCGFPTAPANSYQPGYDLIASGQVTWYDDIIAMQEAVSPTFPLYPTPDTTNTKQYMLVPVAVVVGEGSGVDPGDVWYPFGEMDGVYWFSYADGGAGADALDYMDVGTDRYRVFRAAHRAELSNDFFVFRED